MRLDLGKSDPQAVGVVAVAAAAAVIASAVKRSRCAALLAVAEWFSRRQEHSFRRLRLVLPFC